MKNIISLFWNFIETIISFVLGKVLRIPLDGGKLDAIMQFIKFGLVGVSNTVLHYAIYLVCTLAGVPYMLSNFIAFLLSVLNSFYWNNRYVFKNNEGEQRFWLTALMKTYVAYGTTGLLLSSALLYLEVSVWGMNELIAPIANLLITIPLNFVINKFWAFKGK